MPLSTENKKPFQIEYIFLSVLLIFIAFIRLRLLSFPLERDEGEYAYIGSLLLEGIPPYKEAYNMKFPGTYFMYALNLILFGKTIKAIHIGLLWVNLLTTFFVFLFTRKLFDWRFGIIAATVFGLTSLSAGVLGFAAHATHFVMLPAIAGLYFTYRATETKKLYYYAIAGFLLGCAPLMKQSGYPFPIMGAILFFILNYKKDSTTRFATLVMPIAVFVITGICPLLVTFLNLYFAGVWENFYFWAVIYASDYANQVSPEKSWVYFERTFSGVSKGYIWIWLFSIIGMFSICFIHGKKKEAIVIVCFGILSFLSVSAGLLFRQHYFVQFLPALSISFAGALYLIEKKLINVVPKISASFKWIVLAIVVSISLANENKYFFQQKVNKLCKTIYGTNPFLESIELARYIKEHTKETDKIAVFGSEPQLFFYSDRKSATGYIYTYSLMENQPNSLKMQKEMAKEVEASSPEMIILVNIQTSWLVRPESEKYIFQWYQNYIKTHNYKLIGILNVFNKSSNFLTGADLRNNEQQSANQVYVYQK